MSKNDTELSFLYYYCQFACDTYEAYKKRGIEDKIFGILFLIFGFGVMIISARQGSVDLIIMYMTGFGVRWN